MAIRAVDLLIAYRVIKLLVTPFKNSEAFKAGIIDDKGKVLKPYRLLKSTKEKSSYTMLHRFVFNMKRILGKVGLGSKLGSFAVALGLLLKEDKEFYDEHGKNLERTCYKYLKSIDEFNYTETLNEEYFIERVLRAGKYDLKSDLFDGDNFLPKGTIVQCNENTKPYITALGIDIYNINGRLVPGDYLNAI